jgi:hypothetical protein
LRLQRNRSGLKGSAIRAGLYDRYLALFETPKKLIGRFSVNVKADLGDVMNYYVDTVPAVFLLNEPDQQFLKTIGDSLREHWTLEHERQHAADLGRPFEQSKINRINEIENWALGERLQEELKQRFRPYLNPSGTWHP